MKIISTALTALLLAGLPVPLTGQDAAADAGVPPEVAARIAAFLNHPATIRFSGPSRIPAGASLVGDVGVVGGPFVVAGRIDGDLVVVNGDVDFLAGAAVTGRVTVAGGRIRGRELADVGGPAVSYAASLRLGDVDEPEPPGGDAIRLPSGLGGSRISIRAANSYNRVEGFPVMFGPIFETADPNSFRLEGFLIWRTESGLRLDDDEWGYRLTATQRFGDRRLFAVGGTLHSIMAPIGSLGLSGAEHSLATFLIHRDYRDYYERIGWSAFAQARLEHTPLRLRLEYRDEKHGFARQRSPWTLRRNEEPWRSQPLVGEGDARTLRAELRFDDRNEPDDPTDGWLVTLAATGDVGGRLAIREHQLGPPGTDGPVVEERELPDGFLTGTLDARRYARLGPDSDIRFRAFLAGSIDGEPLPPQYQHAFGGEGTLPGFPLFSQDCGARSRVLSIRAPRQEDPDDAVFGSYGCDRMALFQIQFRRRLFDLPFGLGDPHEDWFGWEGAGDIDLTPSWSVFLDAARGWSRTDSDFDTDIDWAADVGVGLFLGKLGLYWSYPLTDSKLDSNLFIRLEHRF